MKNVLFVCYGLGIGGIEKCLVNLINTMPVDEFDVDILLMNPEFDLRNQIKRNVRFLDSFKYVMNTTDTYPEIKRHGGVISNLSIAIRYGFFRILNKFHKKCWLCFKKTEKKYNYAIAYSHHDYSKYYVIDKVNADRKYLFYHDGVYKLDLHHKKRDSHYFEKFNKIIAVSKCTKDMLCSIYPNISDSIIVLYNIMNPNEIINKSNEFTINKSKNSFIITTVGRMVAQKQVLVAIKIAKMLSDNQYSIVWYWVGDGNQRSDAEKLIKKFGLEKNFILVGNVSNPYPYMKACDLYVQPSRDEAFCTTTNEARILGKVIVTTNCSGMDEQINNGKTGYIVENDIIKIYEKIEYLLNNKNALADFNMNVRMLDLNFDNQFDEYRKEVFN